MRPLSVLAAVSILLGATACAPAAQPTTTAPTPAASASASATGPTIVAAWVGNKNRKQYYLSTCPDLAQMPATDLVSFRTAVDAKAAGYTRAMLPDC
jgi:hypothetical protein